MLTFCIVCDTFVLLLETSLWLYDDIH